MDSRSIAIIGAGVSGLACAQRLQDAGHRPVVFDKGRTPGGRVCTRVTSDGAWDHGAQFIRGRSEAFLARLNSLSGQGAISRWDAPFFDDARPAFVGSPSMRALGDALARPLDVRCSTKVLELRHQGSKVSLVGIGHGEDEARELGEYTHVVLALPGPQASQLAPEFSSALAAIEYEPCWAFMARFDSRVSAPDVLAEVGAAVGFAQRESSRPGREPGERWVFHATPEFSQEHLELSADAAVEVLLAALKDTPFASPAQIHAHRWRYSRVSRALEVEFLRQDPLSVCGDGMLGGRVEAAWTSGHSLGAALS